MLHGFGFRDHSITDRQARQEMRQLTGGKPGLPVVRVNDAVRIGFDRLWLKQRLGLW